MFVRLRSPLEVNKVNFCNVRVTLLSFWTGNLLCGSRTIKGSELNTPGLWKNAKSM